MFKRPTMNKTNTGWVIARGPSNKGFDLHNMVERPLLGHFWDVSEDEEISVRAPRYGKGPSCYTPVDMHLVAKNQYTALKRENRTERPVPLFSGYTFIRGPEPRLIRDLMDRGAIYGLIPDPRCALGSPIVLTDRAIQLMRNKYQAEYDPKTGSGHVTSVNPKAAMIPGYEYDIGSYVISDDPAWLGHKMVCVEVLDTTAKVIIKLFGVDMEMAVPINSVRKAS